VPAFDRKLLPSCSLYYSEDQGPNFCEMLVHMKCGCEVLRLILLHELLCNIAYSYFTMCMLLYQRCSISCIKAMLEIRSIFCYVLLKNGIGIQGKELKIKYCVKLGKNGSEMCALHSEVKTRKV
jgi:hypothetical protein